jgi:ADP-ribose pyrophosphatase YjhB (NUDIX family)
MKIEDAIQTLESHIQDPKIGLPLEIFHFISRLIPMVNVDLLIKDEKGRTLLAWRDDEYCGSGWHIPGGIIRHKERLENRINEVAKQEIGTYVQFEPEPTAMNQVMASHETRGHFISFLYKGFIPGNFCPDDGNHTKTDPGYLEWHETCPQNLIEVHEMYRKYV